MIGSWPTHGEKRGKKDISVEQDPINPFRRFEDPREALGQGLCLARGWSSERDLKLSRALPRLPTKADAKARAIREERSDRFPSRLRAQELVLGVEVTLNHDMFLAPPSPRGNRADIERVTTVPELTFEGTRELIEDAMVPPRWAA